VPSDCRTTHNALVFPLKQLLTGKQISDACKCASFYDYRSEHYSVLFIDLEEPNFEVHFDANFLSGMTANGTTVDSSGQVSRIS
jgi:hypothetical protein